MRNFNNYYNYLLTEFNVEDRNDPAFYDYAVILVQQMLQRGLLSPNETNVTNLAMQIVKNSYYIYKDIENNIAYKILFIFKSQDKSPHNLTVQIEPVPPITSEQPKVIPNTHDEASIADIVDFLELKKQEALQKQNAGTSTPAEVGEVTSKLPGATEPSPVSDTSNYLRGLK